MTDNISEFFLDGVNEFTCHLKNRIEVLLDIVNLSLPSKLDYSAHDLLISLCCNTLISTECRAPASILDGSSQ